MMITLIKSNMNIKRIITLLLITTINATMNTIINLEVMTLHLEDDWNSQVLSLRHIAGVAT